MGVNVVRIVVESDTQDDFADIAKDVLPTMTQAVSPAEAAPVPVQSQSHAVAREVEDMPLKPVAPATPLVSLVPTRSQLRTRVGTAIFCARCRGLEAGRNKRYLVHRLLCLGPVPNSLRVAGCAAGTAIALSILLAARSGDALNQAGHVPAIVHEVVPVATPVHLIADAADPEIGDIATLLESNSHLTAIEEARISKAVVSSARKYGVDPFLVASVLLVESAGDTSKISPRGAVGIMQVHVPAWGSLVDLQQINLFRMEDNIDLGTRILKVYTDQYGRWDGVKRYLGGGELREQSVASLQRIQSIYKDQSPIQTSRPLLRRVVIDAGHGGNDTGTIGPTGLTEKELVLDISNRLKARLESGLDTHVVLTRRDDTFVPLERRTSIANQAKADLFVSIHANSSSSRSIRGFEVYVLNFTRGGESEATSRNSPVSRRLIPDLDDIARKIVLRDKVGESRDIAAHIQLAFATSSELGKNRGVKQAPFSVLAGTDMPAILAEVSFISNADDERLLRGDARRQQIADALFEGIRNYYAGLDRVQIAHAQD